MLKEVVRRTFQVVSVLWTIGMAFPKRLLVPFRKYAQGGQFRKGYVQLEDKVVVITGGDSSLEIAVDLARREAKIIIGLKDPKKGEKMIEEIIDRTGNANVSVMELNLTSFDSIREFAKRFLEKEKRLDILINNAEETDAKWTMQHNHYGHFLLTLLLLDTLKKSSPSRIVVLSSKLHKFARQLCEKSSETSSATGYCRSKLANVVFTRHLAKKLAGTGVTVNCYHEGFTADRILPEFSLKKINPSILEFLFKTPRSAAQTALCLAVDPDLEGVSGKFFSDCVEIEPSDVAKSDKVAEWLWEKSLSVTEYPEDKSP